MATKKTKAKNPAADFMELLGVDPMKAGLMMGYELGRQLKQDVLLIQTTLLNIELHLIEIRNFHEQEKAEKQASKIISSAIATLEGSDPGPSSGPVSDGG